MSVMTIWPCASLVPTSMLLMETRDFGGCVRIRMVVVAGCGFIEIEGGGGGGEISVSEVKPGPAICVRFNEAEVCATASRNSLMKASTVCGRLSASFSRAWRTTASIVGGTETPRVESGAGAAVK